MIWLVSQNGRTNGGATHWVERSHCYNHSFHKFINVHWKKKTTECPLMNNAGQQHRTLWARLRNSSHIRPRDIRATQISATIGCQTRQFLSSRIPRKRFLYFGDKYSPVARSFNLQELESSSWSCKAPFDATKKRELCSVCDVSTLIHCEYTTNKWLRLQFKFFKQICSKLWVFSGLRSLADDVSILLERGASSHKNGELLHSSCISLIQVPAEMQTSWKLSFLSGCTTSPGDNQKRFTNSESVHNNGRCAVENCNNLFIFVRFSTFDSWITISQLTSGPHASQQMEAGATWDLQVADHWIREYLDLKTTKYPKAGERTGFMICSHYQISGWWNSHVSMEEIRSAQFSSENLNGRGHMKELSISPKWILLTRWQGMGWIRLARNMD